MDDQTVITINFGGLRPHSSEPRRADRLNPDSEVAFANLGICRVRRGRVSTSGGTKFAPLLVAGFNPEEVLRTLSEHRFRPEGQIPKIGIWVKWNFTILLQFHATNIYTLEKC
jgi:hypothetical protein